MLQQTAAIDGLTITEIEALNLIAEKFGLIDTVTANTFQHMLDEWQAAADDDSPQEIANNMYNVATGAYQASANVDTLGTSIRQLPAEKTFTLKIAVEAPPGMDWWSLIPGYNIGGQHGLNMVVPPGYPNDSFRVGVSSGELVSVTPANQVTNNFNMTVNSNSKVDQTIANFEIMRALVR